MPGEDLINSISGCLLEMGFEEADDDVIGAIAEALVGLGLLVDGESP